MPRNGEAETAVFPIDDQQTLRYAEAARDYSPYTLDAAAARELRACRDDEGKDDRGKNRVTVLEQECAPPLQQRRCCRSYHESAAITPWNPFE